MTGVLVNFAAIFFGGSLGIIFKKFIKETYAEGIMTGVGLCVMIIGISSALEHENLLLMVFSIVLGTLIGEILKIEDRLNKIGDFMGRKLERRGDSSDFSVGFVTTSLIYCVGAMAILGSLEAGLTGDNSTLYAKSILDGITAILFASTLGIGVLFSSVSVFVYQAILVLASQALKPIFTDIMITELSAVGGIMILAIGINILGIKKIKIGNMLPALLGPVIYYLVIGS